MLNLKPQLVANYEATVATGLENIAKDEVNEKLGVEAITQQGRIWFSTDVDVNILLNLKSISNLFIVIFNETLAEEAIPKDGSGLEPLLMNIAEKCDWSTGLSKWQQMSKFKCKMENLLTKNEELRIVQPKFRVSSNRHGPNHNFTSPEICSVFGHVIDTKFGWPIKLKDYDLEVLVNLNINHLYITFTLSPTSLDCRNIISTGITTLRAATCYALLRVAKIQCGDIVVDPMAGSGAIPVECCYSWRDEWKTYTISGELKPIPLNKCRANLEKFRNLSTHDIIQLDVTSMPFRDNSIDVFVSDLPFGRRHGSKQINKTLYPSLLRDMGRVARIGVARAVLLTQDSKGMSLAYKSCKNLWSQKLCSFVKIGNLNCYIYLFLRTDNKFQG